ncbi:lipid A biosynthesis acyltransferase [Campylobacter sp. FMV-PI01]|uniref:Lipid A biosynthesis acyltransferase n=1 Tax=Campylobacter portucalensis TaxID=2608384 RepID=A0A6L5WKL1_9BACT|nr:lipid A biosynthesis acyltransferase [Campylobacter portucalensis]MSN96545.1 lipid A biosynthesis acyltransferase [Campylobacter portucalensis]
MRDKILYYIYVIFNTIFKIVPKILSKFIVDAFSWLVFIFDFKHNKTAMANLNLVFKDKKTKKEKKRIIFNSYKTLAYNMYELLENQNLPKDEIFKKMRVVNGEIISDALKNRRKIIFITAHYGGWELTLPGIALMYNMKVGVVNKRMKNPYIQKIYAIAREKNNITMIDKSFAAKGMFKTLKDGNQVAIVVDQSISNGVEIEFLGVKEIATDSAARLAIKFNALIIPILTTKNSWREYEITIFEVIDPLKIKEEDKIYAITKLQNDIITTQILKQPNHWLWQHKRFRKYNSHIYY